MLRGNVTHPDKKGHKSKHLYDYEIMKSNTKIPGKLKSHLDFKVHKLTNGDDDRADTVNFNNKAQLCDEGGLGVLEKM